MRYKIFYPKIDVKGWAGISLPVIPFLFKVILIENKHKYNEWVLAHELTHVNHNHFLLVFSPYHLYWYEVEARSKELLYSKDIDELAEDLLDQYWFGLYKKFKTKEQVKTDILNQYIHKVR